MEEIHKKYLHWKKIYMYLQNYYIQKYIQLTYKATQTYLHIINTYKTDKTYEYMNELHKKNIKTFLYFNKIYTQTQTYSYIHIHETSNT